MTESVSSMLTFEKGVVLGLEGLWRTGSAVRTGVGKAVVSEACDVKVIGREDSVEEFEMMVLVVTLRSSVKDHFPHFGWCSSRLPEIYLRFGSVEDVTLEVELVETSSGPLGVAKSIEDFLTVQGTEGIEEFGIGWWHRSTWISDLWVIGEKVPLGTVGTENWS